MSSPNFIYWWNTPVVNGKRKASVHRLVGYCPDTLKYFKNMAELLRQTFPEAKDEDIICSKVRESIRYNQFTIIIWDGEIDFPGEYPGYSQDDTKNPIEYRH